MTPRPGGQQHSTARGPGNDHVTCRHRAIDTQAETLEQAHAAWADQITARLVAADAGLVDETDPCAGLGEDERGDAASRACPDDDHVVTCFRQ